MAVAKVTLNGATLMDITDTTATADKVLTNYDAYGADGVKMSGTATPGGSISLQAKTGVTPTTSSQTITPDSGFDGLSSVQIDAMPSGALSNPSINISSSGLITATSGVGTAGYLATSATASNTQQLTTQGAQTIYPSTTDQAISSGRYLTGAQTIKGVMVTNLNAADIASGVTIQVGDSADSDRIASVTGTLAFQTIYSGSSAPSSSTGSDGDVYIQTA